MVELENKELENTEFEDAEFEKAEYLSARHYGYRVLQRLLGDEPTAELFGAIDADVFAEALAIVGLEDGEADELLCALRAASAATGAGVGEDAGRDMMDELASEYTRALIGPAALPAPPWESVYRDRRRTIMTKTTLEVRIAYQSQGFSPILCHRTPDDHIALELDFLAVLAAKALEAHEAGDAETTNALMEASGKFLHEHLNEWAHEFAADLAAKGKAPFYAAVAKTTAAFARRDEALLHPRKR